jgi:hypothetical protein
MKWEFIKLNKIWNKVPLICAKIKPNREGLSTGGLDLGHYG